MAEYVSVVAPLRNTITLSGSPVSEIAELSPATSAITITNTHTTSAIPPPVIAVETRRTSSERTLYFSGIAILRHRPQRIHDVPPRRRAGRRQRAEQANQGGHHQRLGQNLRRHPDRAERSAYIAD